MKSIQITFVLLVVTLTAYTASPQAAPLYGEQQPNVQRGLGTVNVSWANPNTVLYTCNNPNGFVVLHVVPRLPVGAQPLSFTLSIGSATSAAITTASITVGNTFMVPTSVAAAGTQGQSIVVTPLTQTTGSVTFDINGYEVN